jgi:hypothetical protein
MMESSDTQFLNVDLDLRLKDGLDALLTFLEPAAFILHRTELEAYLELSDCSRPLEDTLHNWIACIEALPPEARELWERCEMRRLNIGIQAGHSPHQVLFTIPEATIASIARARFEIGFTVYAPRPHE